MPPITHSDITERMEQIAREEAAAVERARARYVSERKALQELCGGVGHQWTQASFLIRTCGVCGATEGP